MHFRSYFAMSFTAILGLTACAGPQVQWTHPSKTQAQFAADEEVCRIEGETRVPRPQTPEPKINFQGLANIFSILGQKNRDSQYDAELRHYIGDCLQQKGWKFNSGQ